MVSSDLGNGGLKITYENQPTSVGSTLQVDLERVTPTPEVPAKRSRYV